MRKVVYSLGKAIPVVINVTMISILFYVIFGILGVIFFKGSLFYCTDENINTKGECIGRYFVDGEYVAREWKNRQSNFDNIFSSILLLYEVSGLEMWPDTMYNAVDSVGFD